MPNESPAPRALVGRWAGELLRELSAGHSGGVRLRVAEAAGGLMCLVQVWPSSGRMPTATGERPVRRPSAERMQCREDVLAAVRAAGVPLTRKEVTRALKAAGARHGAGTVAKALAELTKAKGLINHKDKRGYRLPEWGRPHPTLFDDV